MEIVNGTLEWDEVEDRDIWRAFLNSRTGARLLPKALESCPSLLESGDVNAILIRNGAVIGVQRLIAALIALSVPEPKVPETLAVAYPALDDDAAWNDGNKISQ